MKIIIFLIPAFLFGLSTYGQNIGVGTTTPTEKLEIAGNVAIPADKSYKYTSVRTSYLSIPPAAFIFSPSIPTAAQLGGNSVGTHRSIVGGFTDRPAFVFVPLSLPDSATINSITFHVFDNDVTKELVGNLYSINLVNNNTQSIGVTPSTSGTPLQTTINTTISTNNIVNNSTYAYYLRLITYENNDDLRILGAQVTYSVTRVD